LDVWIFLIILGIVISIIIYTKINGIKYEYESLRKNLFEKINQNEKQLTLREEQIKLKAKQYVEQIEQKTEQGEKWFKLKEEQLRQKTEQEEKRLKQKEEQIYQKVVSDMDGLIKDRIGSYKWLAGMMADFMTIEEHNYYLEYGSSYKNMQRHDRAIKINELKNEKKMLIQENKILKYELAYIKNVIPDAEDFLEYDEMGINIYSENFISNYIPKEEYDKLTNIEKNKRALEYYKTRKKTNWEIGRDFERYVGYLFEKEMRATVEYFGMEKGLSDLGRDLIVQTDDAVYIVQCKYWSKDKIIHEKHIAQLFGTFFKYKLDNSKSKKNILPVFVTHTVLSEEAKRFADALNIVYIENLDQGEYPIIKCHNNKDKYGVPTQIYHLPMDQQYDKTIINAKDGDFWAFTVEEAEAKGYSRAHKWLAHS
jgi:hypothetical protein